MDIAHGTIKVDLDDKEAIAGLRKLDAEFDRAMSKIEREHATATVDADITKLEDKLANAKRQVRKLEGEKAQVAVDADTTKLDAKLDKARAEVKRIDGEKATVELDVRGEQKVKAAQEAMRARQAAIAKEAEAALRRQQRLEEQASKDNTRRVNQEARVRSSLHQQQLREMRAAETEAHRINDTMARMEADAAKEHLRRVNNEARVAKSLNDQRIREMRDAENEARRIDKERDSAGVREAQRQLKLLQLQKQYAQAVKNVEKQEFRRTPRGREAKIEVEIDRNMARAKMEALKAELNALGGHPPVDIEVDVDRHDKLGEWLKRAADRFAGVFGGGGGGGGLRASIGPISSSFGTLATAGAALAPVIASVAGALGALIAVAASAAAGLGALALGFTGGLIPAVAGIALVIKPLIGQLGDVQKAQTKYNDAVQKYGEGSKQALAAHHQMRILLGHVDEATVKAFESSGKLSARWKELTAPSKAVAFTVIGQALRTAAADLQTFATGTNRVFGAAGKAVEGWLKGLRSPEAKGILSNLMGNFAQTIGPLADGLGSIFTWLGRIASVASNFLPGIAKGFAAWAKGIADAAKNTPGVEKTLTRMVKSLSSVGRLFVSGGKFLAAFFDGGVESGQNLADTISNTLDSWTKFLKSTKGKEELKTFFKNAVDDAVKLGGILADVSTGLYNFSQAMRPIISIVSDVWNALAPLVKGLAAIANYRTPDWGIRAQKDAIDAVAGALQSMWGVLQTIGKGAVGAFQGIWSALQAVGRFAVNMATTVVGAMVKVHDAINSAGRGIAGIASKAVKIGVDFASGGIDKAKSAISSVTKLGGQVVKVGFQFASGAVNSAIGLVKRLLALGGSAVRIAASFASGVISGAIGLVKRLLGLSGGAVRIGASFASGVISGAIGLVRKLLAFTGRIVHIGTSVALGPINAALGALRAVMGFAGKVITLSIHIPTPHIPHIPGLNASGRSAGSKQDSFVGEGGGPEFIANRKSGMVAMTDGPMLAKLTKDDYVIPTEPKYRARGARLAAQFGKDTGTDANLSAWMKMFGIEGYKVGKAPPRTATKTAQQRKASGGYAKKDVRNRGAYTEINRVQSLQQQEADQSARISLAEGALKEPDSFITKTGTDAEGNDLWEVNQDAVTKWSAALANIRDMYNTLVSILRQLAQAVQEAIHAVQRTVTSSNHNIGVLNSQETHEKNIIKNAKGKNKATVKANANQRLQWLQAEEERQKQIRSDALDSQDDLDKETQFAGGVGTPGKPGQRILEALQESDSYNTESAAVAAMAAGQAASANPQPGKPGAAAVAGPFDALNLTGSALTAEAALTAIGQGTRTPAQIVADQIANDQSIINTAKGLLSDADPTNDESAYSAITGAANDIAGLQSSQGAPAATQLNTLAGARGDLFKSMGSNFSSGNAAGAMMAAPVSSGPGPGVVAPVGATAGAGRTINVVNNYQTQPVDPHTWSRNVLFELQAAG